MKHVIVVAFVALVAAIGVRAQEPKQADVPVLTEVQKLTMVSKAQAAQLAAKDATREALAKAIADLIYTKQQQAVQADQAATEYYQSLQKPGFTLDPQTWVYVPVPEKPKGGGLPQ